MSQKGTRDRPAWEERLRPRHAAVVAALGHRPQDTGGHWLLGPRGPAGPAWSRGSGSLVRGFPVEACPADLRAPAEGGHGRARMQSCKKCPLAGPLLGA